VRFATIKLVSGNTIAVRFSITFRIRTTQPSPNSE
jgi:hypothetical protein